MIQTMKRHTLLHIIYSVALILISFSGSSYSFQGKELLISLSAAINDHSHNPGTVVLRYTETQNLMGEAEGGTSLHIYSDGYAHVYYPAYMKRAGNYGLYLEPDTMDHLWSLLTSAEILEFDGNVVRQRVLVARQKQKESLLTFTNVSDASSLIIEIYPNRYKSVEYMEGDINAFKKIYWSGLRWDAQQFPEIKKIQSLANIQQVLLAIMARSDLKKIE